MFQGFIDAIDGWYKKYGKTFGYVLILQVSAIEGFHLEETFKRIYVMTVPLGTLLIFR